jgi:hypothetical protein
VQEQRQLGKRFDHNRGGEYRHEQNAFVGDIRVGEYYSWYYGGDRGDYAERHDAIAVAVVCISVRGAPEALLENKEAC